MLLQSPGIHTVLFAGRFINELLDYSSISAISTDSRRVNADRSSARESVSANAAGGLNQSFICFMLGCFSSPVVSSAKVDFSSQNHSGEEI